MVEQQPANLSTQKTVIRKVHLKTVHLGQVVLVGRIHEQDHGFPSVGQRFAFRAPTQRHHH